MATSLRRARASRARRRGIVLLFVLGLLALFSLVTVTYVLVARAHAISALRAQNVERSGDAPEMLLRKTMLQVIRGDYIPGSSISHHNLLEDIYGNTGWVTGQLAMNAVNPAYDLSGNVFGVGQIISLYSTGATTGSGFFNSANYWTGPTTNTVISQVAISQINGYYAGRVLTMTSGLAAGQSTRIVDYAYDSTGGSTAAHFNVMAFANGVTPQQGDSFLINGAPFSGTGFGFSAIAAQTFNPLPTAPVPAATSVDTRILLGQFDPTLTADLNGRFPELALLPNGKFFVPSSSSLWGTYAGNFYLDPAGPGGAHEEYDAADYQNMMLAMRSIAYNSGGQQSVMLLPSLHRPDLLQYWLTRYLGSASVNWSDGGNQEFQQLYNKSPALVRRILMRPVGALLDRNTGSALFTATTPDHPLFTGSNPTFDIVLGPWDVDNDNDGVPDSIWVDIGLPVQTAADGRTYKPLVAILCEDLDGKLNLNAHGNLNQLVQTVTNATVFPYVAPPTAGLAASTPPPVVVGPYAGTAGPIATPSPNTVSLFYGQGYGPAEINLAVLIENNASVVNSLGSLQQTQIPPSTPVNTVYEYANLLAGIPNVGVAQGQVWASTGIVGERIEGRYGEVALVGLATDSIATGASAPLPPSTYPSPGHTVEVPGTNYTDWFDLSAWLKEFEMPYNYQYFNGTLGASLLSAYGTAPDLDGDGVVGLDLLGNPLNSVWQSNSTIGYYAGCGEQWERINNPYQLDLSRNAPHEGYNLANLSGAGLSGVASIDKPFSPQELERLLRYNDVDASNLANRLVRLAPFTLAGQLASGAVDTYGSEYRRRLVTTESWDVPCPAIAGTADMITQAYAPSAVAYTQSLSTAISMPVPNLYYDSTNTTISPVGHLHISDMLNLRIRREYLRLRGTNAPALSQETARYLLGPEISAGLKFDLNRPFGNGIDDNSNGIVDEPYEGSPVWYSTVGTFDNVWASAVVSTVAPFFHNNFSLPPLANQTATVTQLGKTPQDDTLDRQNFARNLYCLMMLLLDENFRVQVEANFTATPPLPGQPSQGEIALATQVAQWAVNVVDYRDRDAIITGFEFDVRPFTDEDLDGNPWDVDGSAATNETQLNPALPTPIARGVVWGVEKPELLISESMAFRDDRRTADTNQDPGTMLYTNSNPVKDPDFDQPFRPIGTLLVELYNPSSLNDWPSSEFYQTLNQATVQDARNVNALALQLDALTPTATAGASGPSPIWRIATVATNNPANVIPPESLNGMTIDRTVYFTSQPASGTNPAATITENTNFFYRSQGNNNPIYIAPDHYLVIGPGDVGTSPPTSFPTAIYGQTSGVAPASTVTMTLNTTSTPSAAQNGVTFAGTTLPYPTVGTNVRPVGAAVIDMPRRLSVSEPYKNSSGDNYTTESTTAAVTGPPMNSPWDALVPNSVVGTLDGTVLRQGIILLQRLANPMFPWNPEPYNLSGPNIGQANLNYNTNLPVNPYITVDRLPYDLTSYTSGASIGTTDTKITNTQSHRFASRERGTVDSYGAPNIWPADMPSGPSYLNVPYDPPVVAEATGMKHSFGYLNLRFQTIWPVLNTSSPALTSGYGTTYYGDPAMPFPWLTWNNRPFTGAYDLLHVSPYDASRMLMAHTVRDPAATITNGVVNPFALVGMNTSLTPYTTFGPLALGYIDYVTTGVNGALPFAHQTPYFVGNFSSATGTTQVAAAPQMYRIFDYVHVPSRFAGTDTYLSSTVMAGGAPNPSTVLGTTTHTLHPPFNHVSRYREPGKVNINTICDDGLTLRAILNDAPATTSPPAISAPTDNSPAWNTANAWNSYILPSRTWATTSAGAPLTPLYFNTLPYLPSNPNAPSPSINANPFRSQAGTYLIPVESLRHSYLNNGVTSNTLSGIDCTLLRSTLTVSNALTTTANGTLTATPNSSLMPIFSYNNNLLTNQVLAPNPNAISSNSANNTNQSPYFHYQLLSKLGNTVTTRSNVYAVWITVGYFQATRVTPGQPPAAPADPQWCPDGWQLGAELGSDTGDIQRHRAFFIFDRSIPVGFQRGEDHNIEDAILLQRFIE